MRHLFPLTLLVFLSFPAHATQWRIVTPKTYTLAPVEDVEFFALIHMHEKKLNVILIEESGHECLALKKNGMPSATSLKINGAVWNFFKTCINGDNAFAPKTPLDNEALVGALTTGRTIIELDNNIVLHFEGAGFQAIRKGMLHGGPPL